MSPSISAFGTRAATESITTTSTAPDRTRISVISSPCSPVSGWETSRLSMSTPSFFAYSTSSACSASMYAAAPPSRWAFATTCSANVVLPLDSGPKISVTRPRGMPPIPIAASRLIAPVGIASTRTCGESAPIRMMAPLPQVFSIWVMARLSAFLRSSVSLGGSALAAIMGVLDMGSGPPGLRPEYIPKLRLAPSGAKRVRQVLQLAVRQRDTIEAIDVRRPAVAIYPDPRRPHQLPPLGARDRLERAPERVPASGLHLHEGDEASLLHDQIDLGVAHAKPVRHDVPPAGEEVLDRLLLAREPPLVPFVGPPRRVAAQAASHTRQPIGAPTTNVIESARTVPFQCGMRSAECGISRLGRAALDLCLPANLIQLLEPHQQLPGFAAVRGAEDPGLLELVDDTRRPAVADAHAPLQQRGRADLVLDADFGGLPEQGIARAFALPPPRSSIPGFFRFLDLLHLLDDIHLDPLLELSAALRVPRHQPLGLVGRDERTLDAHQLALAGRQEQHVAVAEQCLGAVLVEDGPAVDLGRNAEPDAAGEVRLDQPGDDVHRRALRGENQVEPDGARLLRQRRERRLHFVLHRHHQVRHLVHDHHDVRQHAFGVLGVERQLLLDSRLGGQRLALPLQRLPLAHLAVEVGDVARVVGVEQLVAALHLAHRPLERGRGLLVVGHHGVPQMGQRVVHRQLDHLRVDHQEPELLRRVAAQAAGDARVDAT